jgi:hypothetical protein
LWIDACLSHQELAKEIKMMLGKAPLNPGIRFDA